MDMFGVLNQLKNMQNPQQALMGMFKQKAGNNQFANDAIGMMQKNDYKGLEEMARKIGKQKGVDVDQMFAQIQKSFGGNGS